MADTMSLTKIIWISLIMAKYKPHLTQRNWLNQIKLRTGSLTRKKYNLLIKNKKISVISRTQTTLAGFSRFLDHMRAGIFSLKIIQLVSVQVAWNKQHILSAEQSTSSWSFLVTPKANYYSFWEVNSVKAEWNKQQLIPNRNKS